MADDISPTKEIYTAQVQEVESDDWNDKTFFPFQQDQERQQIRIDQHAASFPKVGIGALVGALTLIALSGVILLVIQGPGKVVSDWTVHVYHTHRYVTIPKPAAWLSAILSGISVCFSIALSEGLNIAWWYHVRQERATVRELHNIWGHGTSTWAVVKGGAKSLKSGITGLSRRNTDQTQPRKQRNFSYVALATLFVATIPLNGFLLQNAVVVKLEPTTKNATITVPMLNGERFGSLQQVQAMGLPGGGVSQWSPMLGKLSQIVTPKVAAIANLGSFNTSCIGSCNTTVKGMGFKIQCEDLLQPYNIAFPSQDPNDLPPKSMFVNGTNVVTVAVTYNYRQTNRITLHSVWKDTATCKGNYKVQICHLDLADVEYPVIINTGVKEATQSGLRNTTIMTLDMDLLKESPNVVSITPSEYSAMTSDTTYPVAGLAGLLAQTLNSSINLRYDYTQYYGFTLAAQGLFLQQQLATTGEFTYPACQGTIGNVSQSALAIVKSMMFQMGAYNFLSSWGSNDTTEYGSCPIGQSTADCVADNTPRLIALNSYQRNEYTIVWAWYFGAMAVTTMVSLFILPTFWGYWRLERRTTMSPFETARAFHAPVLYQEDSTVRSRDLMKRVGDVQIHRDLPVVRMPEPGAVK